MASSGSVARVAVAGMEWEGVEALTSAAAALTPLQLSDSA